MLLNDIHESYKKAVSENNVRAAYHLRVAAGFVFRDMFDIKVNTKKRFTPTQEEVKLGENVSKVEAIKTYRYRTGLGLLESKHAIEEHFKRHNLTFHPY